VGKGGGKLRQGEGGVVGRFAKHRDSCWGWGRGGEPGTATPKGHDLQAAASV